MPRQPARIRHFAPRVGRIAWAAPGSDSFLSGPCQPCQLGPDSGLWLRLGTGVRKTHGPKTKCPKTKWGSALLPAPTVAAAGTLAIQRLSSPRPSAVPCPSVSRSFERSASGPLGRPVLPASRLFLSASTFSPAAYAVPDRMGLAVAGAVAACLPRYRVSGCCWRVAFSCPSGTAPVCASLAGLAFGRIPKGKKGPSARLGVLPLAWRLLGVAPGFATIGLAASALLRDAVPASGTGLSGLQSAPSKTCLSTPKVVSMHTFKSGPIGKFPLLVQCLAAPFRSFVSLSTSQMLRLDRESHKQQNAKLSTGSPMAGGQLCKLRNRLRIYSGGDSMGGDRAQFPRWARRRNRSALSLMKPAASFWS